jgi:hypothetical protein
VFSPNGAGPAAAATITYPSPSTTSISATAATSTAYLQPQGKAGTAYMELATSNSPFTPIYTENAAIPVGDPDGYRVYTDWQPPGGPNPLTSGTHYFWRMRFVPSSGAPVTGAVQEFTMAAGNQATIGTGVAGSCTAAALQTALSGPATDIRFNCGPLPVEIALTSTLTINRSLTLDGDDLVTLKAPPGSRHLTITAGAVVLRDMIFTGANHTLPCGAIDVAPPSGAQVTIASSRVSGNTTTSFGGGVCARTNANLTVVDSVISGNRAGDSGGGIFSQWNLDVLRSDISANVAAQNGGGIAAPTGGAIISQSLLAGNVAGSPSSTTAVGGALLTGGYTTVRDTTLSGNTAGEAAAILAGGGDYVEINGVTIAGNTARASAGSAVRVTSTWSNRIENTILDGNAPRNCPVANTGGWSITSYGYNLDSGSTCATAAIGDVHNAVVRLGPLAFNGGPTRTHALLAGSPAIDTGNNNRCNAADQRGVSVPNGIGGTHRRIDGDGNGSAICDVGAFEVQRDGVAPTVAGIDLLDATPTAATSVRWRVRFSDPVYDVDAADLALPAAGIAGAAVSSVTPESPAPSASWTVTASTGTGDSGTVRLDVNGGASIYDASNMPLAGGAAGATYTISRGAGPGGPGSPGVPGGPGGPGAGGYLPLVPARIADTRSPNATIDGVSSGGGKIAGGATYVVPVAGRGGVPVGTTSVSLNVTLVDPDGAGFATVWPCDQAQPNASNLNYRSSTIPNSVITKLAADGSVCVYTYAAAHVLIDVNGGFGAGSEFTALVPARLADTRAPGGSTVDDASAGGGTVTAGQTLVVPVAGRGGVPAGATAVSLNLTAVGPHASGYATVWPCDQPQPNASNVNYGAGVTIPNAVLTKLAGDGTVCIYTYAAMDVLVDVNGSFSGATTFLSLVPARVADTRSPNATIDGVASGGGAIGAGATLRVPIAGRGGVPTTATAVSLNVTAVDPGGSGYATVWPCDQSQPNASNLNFGAGQTIPNAVLTKLAADGSVCVFTSASTHLLIDVNGAL